MCGSPCQRQARYAAHQCCSFNTSILVNVLDSSANTLPSHLSRLGGQSRLEESLNIVELFQASRVLHTTGDKVSGARKRRQKKGKLTGMS